MLTSARRHAPFVSCHGEVGQSSEPTEVLSGMEDDVPRNLTPGNAADSSPSPRSSNDWQDPEAIDLSDDREKSPSNDGHDDGTDDDVDPDNYDDVDEQNGNLFEDSSSGNRGSSDGNNIARAKRARVENIVTNIRDRPTKSRSPFIEDDEDGSPSTEQGEPRKRRIDGNFSEWQEKIFQSSPGEFIHQALNLVAASEIKYDENEAPTESDSPRSGSDALPAGSWSPKSKRARFDEGYGSTDNVKIKRQAGVKKSKSYRDAIKHSIPRQRKHLDRPVYDVILETVRSELSFEFGKITERLARRVYDELELDEEENSSSTPDDDRSDDYVRESFVDKERASRCQGDNRESERTNGDERIDDASERISAYPEEERIERLQTSSRSQMCFGDVEVRRSDSAGNEDGRPGYNEVFHPELPSLDGSYTSKDTRKSGEVSVGIYGDNKPTTPVSAKLTEQQDDGEQAQALALVKRKPIAASTSISPGPSTSRHSQRPLLVALEGSRMRKSWSQEEYSTSSERARYSALDDVKARTDPRAIPSLESHSYSPSASRKTTFSSYIAPRASSLVSPQESPFQPTSGWAFTPSSSAFRYPHQRPQNVLSPSRHFSSPHLDMQQKLISSLASPPRSGAAAHMKPPPLFAGKSHLASSLYSPLQSSFPFSPSQIPFPLLPAFHQGALASVIASGDYGRLREGLDLQHLAARTGTRDSIKSRVSGLGHHHLDIKCDSSDYMAGATEVSPYSAQSMQEGLSPQHLKKAKLMFFYTRYPSANTLKTYFSDVKFTRATTSQLIKWFSNFREFYYIQMEKFARQALTDGITDANQLQVSRDSELFRVLNLHYNKSNDFTVPHRFIEVTMDSLREFFRAIQAGKDHDPAWKKVIYKVICKLDQEIPELFKSPNVLEHLADI